MSIQEAEREVSTQAKKFKEVFVFAKDEIHF